MVHYYPDANFTICVITAENIANASVGTPMKGASMESYTGH